MQPLKILFVTPQYPPAIGGTEQLVAGWAEELVRRGHQAHVFTTRSTHQPTWRGSLPSYEERGGVRVWRFRQWERGRRTMRLMDWGYSGFLRTGQRRYEAGIWLAEGPVAPGLFAALLVRSRSYDAIISMSASTLTSLVVCLVSQRAHTVWINVPLLHLDQLLPRAITGRQHILSSASLLLPVSGIEASVLQTRFGIPGSRIQVIPPIVPMPAEVTAQTASRAQLGLPADAFIVAFLARQVAYKGFHLTVEAISRLLREFPNLMLVSAGPKDTADNLPDATRSEGFCMRWRNLGTVDEETKWRLLSACDVLCMPSTGEAFGIVYAEAWVCGKPVIGANSGAVPGVITHGVDGFVVEPGDVEGLAGYLAKLQQHPDLARKMGQAGRRKALTHFTARSVGDALEGALARALRLGRNKRLRIASESG